jgi:hypothetical protein
MLPGHGGRQSAAANECPARYADYKESRFGKAEEEDRALRQPWENLLDFVVPARYLWEEFHSFRVFFGKLGSF